MESIEMEFTIPGVDGKPGLKLLGRNLKEALTIALDSDTLLDELVFLMSPLAGLVAMGAQFGGSQWRHTFLMGAVMPGCNFERSRFEGVDAVGAYFAGSSFYECHIEGSRFDGSNLAGCGFRGAYLHNVSFRGADLSGVFIDPLTRFIDCDFAGAKLRGTNIEYT